MKNKPILLNLNSKQAVKLDWLKNVTEKNYTDVLRTALERYYNSEVRKYEQLQQRRETFRQQIKDTKAQVKS